MICPNCDEKCDGEWIDEGVGEYEYWGAKGNDVQMVFVCEHCGEALETTQSYEDYRSEMIYERYRDY